MFGDFSEQAASRDVLIESWPSCHACEGEAEAAREAASGEILHVDEELHFQSQRSVWACSVLPNEYLKFLRKLAGTRKGLWSGHPGLCGLRLLVSWVRSR